MITIRPEQMAAFEKAALMRFEDEMVAHGREFAPKLARAIGDIHVVLGELADLNDQLRAR